MEGINLDLLREAIAWQEGKQHRNTYDVQRNYPGVILAAAKAYLEQSEPKHPDYDVALPEIEEWVNRNGTW